MKSDDNPNFAFLSYSKQARSVEQLFVVPKHFVVPDIIEERKPLAPTARRAGWIGCNIRLSMLPQTGKIYVVRNGEPQAKSLVQAQWQKTLFLRDSKLEARGWLVDVMACCDQIGRAEFAIHDVYAFEGKLAVLYPGNRHIKHKMRQQLQVLRDSGYLEFLGRGRYRLI